VTRVTIANEHALGQPHTGPRKRLVNRSRADSDSWKVCSLMLSRNKQREAKFRQGATDVPFLQLPGLSPPFCCVMSFLDVFALHKYSTQTHPFFNTEHIHTLGKSSSKSHFTSHDKAASCMRGLTYCIVSFSVFNYHSKRYSKASACLKCILSRLNDE
jgi:hypothetical protein